MVRLLSCIGVLVLLCGRADAQGARPSKAGAVVHVVVSGDIECLHAAKELRTVLNEAQRDRAALVVLEIGGDESRLDVVREMAKAVRDTPVPVIVFLNDRDKTVGAGALCLGMIASECVVAPSMTIRGRAADSEAAALAPDKTEWTVLIEEFAGWIQRNAETRGWPEGIAGPLISPSRTVWAAVGSGAYDIVYDTRPAGEALPVVIEDNARHVVSLDARAAVRLRLASTTLDSWTMIAGRKEYKAGVRVERSIGASVGPQQVRAEAMLEACDRSYEHAKKTLKLSWPAARDVAPSVYRQAAAEGREALASAGASLVALEGLLEQYPEVMRRPAPGQTEVGGKPSTYASRWRSMIQSRRDKIVKLMETAEKFAGV